MDITTSSAIIAILIIGLLGYLGSLRSGEKVIIPCYDRLNNPIIGVHCTEETPLFPIITDTLPLSVLLIVSAFFIIAINYGLT